MMSNAKPVVYIVDDNEAVRKALLFLFKTESIQAAAYSGANELLENISDLENGILIVDVRMPGMTGLELQSHLVSRGKNFPIIFITGHGDISMAVSAMKNGAVDFIEKPFSNDRLLESVRKCFEREQMGESSDADCRQLMMRLTNREREVMDRLTEGKTNKETAYELGISPRTVEVHRSNIMEKLQARNLPDLVRIALRNPPEIS